MNLNADTVYGISVKFLAAKYDNPKPIPAFHEEMWELCCSDASKVAIASPRMHGKSTAITHAFILSAVLSKEKSFVLLVSGTEGQSAEFLGDIKVELEGNDEIKAEYGIKFLKDTETNVIAQMADGHIFRIQAKGSEQKVRGLKWRGKRPDLIVCDDLEEDEQVQSPERREKFRNWFMNALMPCGSDTCVIRVVGTVLHLDSMLNRLLKDPTWESKKYKAHNHDFTEILWLEKFPKEKLLDIRAGFEAQNNLGGYSREYLNEPVAEGDEYFNPDYFYDFERDSNDKSILPNLEYYAAADFAISEKEKADYTAIVVAGLSPEGILYVVDVNCFRGDADRIVEELIATQRHWNPHTFTVEDGQISKSLGPAIKKAMYDCFPPVPIPLNPITPIKSKTMRGKSIQKLHKAGGIRYDKLAAWYPAFETELLTVANDGTRGTHDDQFDAFAYIGLSVDKYFEAYSDEELEEDARAQELEDYYYNIGRCRSTGY